VKVSDTTVRSKPRTTRRIAYAERDFIAWDGEADTGKDGKSNYVLFGNSEGWEVSSPRLDGMDCIRLIFETAKAYPMAIHVGFGLGFDINMLVRDFPRATIQRLKKDGKTWLPEEQILVEYLPKKWIRLYNATSKQSVTIFDTFTFFMSSAVKAWQEYLPDWKDLVSEVSVGKDARDHFEYSQLEELIRPYFRNELQLYVRLMERLRELLSVAGIHPKGWYGPGAIAGTVLKQRTSNLIQRDLPEGVKEAAAYAYFGGRFEQFYTGHYKGPIWSYDIRSAYPHALRLCPDLAFGEWEHLTGFPDRIEEFALYRVDFDYDRSGGVRSGYAHLPMPFPYRDSRGQIHYPARVRGWYWGCEVKSALQWYNFRITEAYVFHSTSDSKPFAFIEKMYEQRDKWKRQGNQAQLALKLGINSIYGKLAQRVGWNQDTYEPPKWHQLEYAGFATAKCRSMLYSALMQAPMSIIAVETDGVFTSQPLSLELGRELGTWEEETYDGLIYVQSGVYYLSRWKRYVGHEWFKARTRGFGAKSISVGTAINGAAKLDSLTGQVHRFAGFNGYLWKAEWLGWIDRPQVAVWGGSGKRSHASALCERCLGDTTQQMHSLVISKPWGGDSHPHFLPWKQDLNEYQKASDENRDIELQPL
jgi:hypothetical protein